MFVQVVPPKALLGRVEIPNLNRTCTGVSMNLHEFVRKLELGGIEFEISQWGDATYVELHDGPLHLGFRFNQYGDLSGGWLRPPNHYDFKSQWKRWGDYLQ